MDAAAAHKMVAAIECSCMVGSAHCPAEQLDVVDDEIHRFAFDLEDETEVVFVIQFGAARKHSKLVLLIRFWVMERLADSDANQPPQLSCPKGYAV